MPLSSTTSGSSGHTASSLTPENQGAGHKLYFEVRLFQRVGSLSDASSRASNFACQLASMSISEPTGTSKGRSIDCLIVMHYQMSSYGQRCAHCVTGATAAPLHAEFVLAAPMLTLFRLTAQPMRICYV